MHVQMNQKVKLLIASLACLFAASIASQANAAPRAKTSSEFGAYIEDDLIYGTPSQQAYAEYGESSNFFNKSDWWGNSDFGAGYNTNAGANAGKSSSSAFTGAWAGLSTSVKLFGNSIPIVDVYANASSRMRPVANTASFSVYVKGSQIFSRSGTSANWSWSQDLFSWHYSKTFYAGGWPVKVTAGLTGSASASYYAGVQPTYESAYVNGRAGLYAMAKGEIGVSWLAGAAAWANLTLVEPTLAFHAVQSWDFRPVSGGCAVTFWKGSNGTLTVASLKGNVKIQAQYLGFTNTATIFSWPGFSTTYNLIPNTMTAKVVTDGSACPTVGS